MHKYTRIDHTYMHTYIISIYIHTYKYVHTVPTYTIHRRYLLDKATRYHGNWLAVRASYGMNGIFLPSADLETFAAYLVKHQVRLPRAYIQLHTYIHTYIHSTFIYIHT